MALAVGLISILLAGEASHVAARTLRGVEFTTQNISNQTQRDQINIAKDPQLGSQVLRVPANASVNFAIVPGSSAAPFTPEEENVEFEILKATHLKVGAEESECLCPLGTFWHWRINQCVEHGGWGYECGFFPKEHWHRVCKDGLTCKKLRKVEDNYHAHGQYLGEWNSKPATCLECDKEDGCKAGMKRHLEECVRKNGVTGEACATVRVTVPITAKATATETATVEVKIKVRTESATATAGATATATATIPGTNQKVSATATETATVNADKTTPTVTKKVTASATATEEPEANGKAEATACVKAAEAYELETGKEAMIVKGKNGGEVSKAPSNSTSATPSDSSSSSSSSSGTGYENKVVPEVSNELAAKVKAKADEVAFERAYQEALKAAKEAGRLNANELANQQAHKTAYEEALKKAQAKADALAGKVGDAGAAKAAADRAKKGAEKAAKEAARIEAERLARAKAEAAAQAAAAAEKRAEDAAKEMRKKAADDSAANRNALRRIAEAKQKAAHGAPSVNDAMKSLHGRTEEVVPVHSPEQAKDLMDGVADMLKGQGETPRAEQHEEKKVFRKINEKQKAKMYP